MKIPFDAGREAVMIGGAAGVLTVAISLRLEAAVARELLMRGLLHLGIFIQHIVKSQFSESAPRLFDLLFGNTSLGRNFYFHSDPKTAAGSELGKHSGIEVHPFLRGDFSAPSQSAETGRNGFGFGR
jgi:hypothetical protein